MLYRDERENDVEGFAVQEAARRKGIALKFQTPGRIGAPDRIVILPGPRIGFLELKHPVYGKIRAGQPRYHKLLKGFGLLVEFANSKAAVIRFMNALELVQPMSNHIAAFKAAIDDILQ